MVGHKIINGNTIKAAGNKYKFFKSREVEAKTFPFTPEGKIAAACWYDTKAIEYFGEFHGQLNFPTTSDR